MEARTLTLAGLAALLLLLPTLAGAAQLTARDERATAADCDPFPLGRCGAFQREHVFYCWMPASSGFGPYKITTVPATDANVVAVGSNGASLGGLGAVDLGPDGALPPVAPGNGLPSVDGVPGARDLAYVRLEPLQAFAADPFNAPAPAKVVWQEANNAAGLQPKAGFNCATFWWYAECVPPQWMQLGPVNVNMPADAKLA